MRRRRAAGHRATSPRRLPPVPADAGANARGVRERGWKHGRRVPDAQPDPSRARVHPEVRARDRRRIAAAPARRRDQGRRRPRGRPDALLSTCCSRTTTRRIAPWCRVFPAAMRYAGPREAIWHAIAARTTAARTSSSVATTPAWAPTTARTTRSASSTSSTPGELGDQTLSFEHSFWCNVVKAWRRRRRARTTRRRRLPVGHEGARHAARAASVPPQEFSRPEVADMLIDAMGGTAGWRSVPPPTTPSRVS